MHIGIQNEFIGEFFTEARFYSLSSWSTYQTTDFPSLMILPSEEQFVLCSSTLDETIVKFFHGSLHQLLFFLEQEQGPRMSFTDEGCQRTELSLISPI